MSSAINRLCLSQAPADILLRFFSCLEPDDIIRLRLTCARLSSVTRHRKVWLDALRRACYRNGIVFPTHKEDTASTEELEHAAISQYRVSAYLQRAHSISTVVKLQPSRVQGVLPVQGYQYKSLGIVPGGRFLATLEAGDCNALRLYDLSYIVSNGQEARVIAQTSLPINETIKMSKIQCGAFVKKRTSTIVVMLTVLSPTLGIAPVNRKSHLVYYIHNPLCNNPQFKLIGRYDHEQYNSERDEQYSTEREREWLAPESSCIIMRGYDMVVWNYESDKVATVADFDDFLNGSGDGVHVATLIGKHLTVWKELDDTPGLTIETYRVYPRDFYSRTSAQTDHNSLVRRGPKRIAVDQLDIKVGFNDLLAFTSPHHDRIQDIVVSNTFTSAGYRDPSILCYRTTLDLKRLPVSPKVNRYTTRNSPIFLGNVVGDHVNRELLESWRFITFNMPYQDMTMMWTDQEKKGLYLKVISRHTARDIVLVEPSARLRFDTYGPMAFCTASFCQFSGRLCYIDHDSAAEGVIQVVEYA